MGFEDYQTAMTRPKIPKGTVSLDYIADILPKEVLQIWNTLSDSQKRAIINDDAFYRTDKGFHNLWGLTGASEVLNEQALLDELSNISQMQADYAALGSEPIFDDYLSDARAQANAQVAELMKPADDLLAQAGERYKADLADISDDYANARRGLLTQQYQNNAQLMDTLSSSLDRNRRNALEAGASAGIRIAENINTLLSVQNKQSAAAMDTANQLSQMMIDQRAQERSVQDVYDSAQRDHMNRKQELTLGAEDRAVNTATTNYNAAYGAYDRRRSEIDNKYMGTNMYDYRGMFTPTSKSKYGS